MNVTQRDSLQQQPHLIVKSRKSTETEPVISYSFGSKSLSKDLTKELSLTPGNGVEVYFENLKFELKKNIPSDWIQSKIRILNREVSFLLKDKNQ